MPEFYVIFARKIIEMPELFIIFAQKLTKKSRFNHDICPKNIYLYSLHGAAEADIFLYFPDFFGGGREVGRARAPPPLPLDTRLLRLCQTLAILSPKLSVKTTLNEHQACVERPIVT